jgi:hypothetical protein
MALQAIQKQQHDRDILVMEDIEPVAQFGSQRLIAAHLGGAPVDIKSWGTAETVYEEVTAKLIAYGVEQGIAQNFVRGLVDYAVEKASEFQSEHQAKIIALRIAVNETNPDPQFETGPVATFRLNGASRQAQMASASGQNVRSTISGTATTTSDRSSVENVFMGVKEWSVWGKIEAPDKSELKQVAPGVIAVALAQMAAGELTPEEAATLQAQLEALAAEGLVAPEMAGVVGAIETMRTMLEAGITPDAAAMQSLAGQITQLITQGVENGNLSPELARQIVESVAAFSETHGLEQVFSADMMQSVSAMIEWTAMAQALEQILPHLSAQDRAAIHAIMENDEVPSAEILAEHLAVINEVIAQADLPEAVAAHVASIEGSSAALQEIAQSQIEAAGLDASSISVDLATLSLSDVQAMIQALGDMDTAALTLEQAEILQALQEAMGTVDLVHTTPEQIEAALKGEGDPAITEALQVIAATLSQPEIASALPADVQAAMTTLIVAEGGTSLPQSDAPSSPAGGADGGDIGLEGGDNVIAFPVDAAVPSPPDEIEGGHDTIASDLSDVVPENTPETGLDGVSPADPDIVTDGGPTGGPEIIADPVPDNPPPLEPELQPEHNPDPVQPPEQDNILPPPPPEPEDKLPTPEPKHVLPPPPPPADHPEPAVPENKLPTPGPGVKPGCGPECQCDFGKAAGVNTNPKPPVITVEQVQEKFTPEEIQKYGGVEAIQKVVAKYTQKDIDRYGGEEKLLRLVVKDAEEQNRLRGYIQPLDDAARARIDDAVRRKFGSPAVSGEAESLTHIHKRNCGCGQDHGVEPEVEEPPPVLEIADLDEISAESDENDQDLDDLLSELGGDLSDEELENIFDADDGNMPNTKRAMPLKLSM